MSWFSPSQYARWRMASVVGSSVVRDAAGEVPDERLLQQIWWHQRLRREELRLLDGRSVSVLHPGFLNQEAGPDFRGAVIAFEGGPAQSGDVEVDLESAGWRAHGHDRNPRFARVILHVVWEAKKKALESAPLPTLVIRDFLPAPWPELETWLGAEGGASPASLAGRCRAPLRELGEPEIKDLLGQAARVRLEVKAAAFCLRAREAGWEQSLWEGLLRALGYKHNVWPMQRLGELRLRWMQSDDRRPPSVLELQARLLGIAGLLPAELPRSRSTAHAYARRIWDAWWRERDAFEDCLLPPTLWRMSGVRPANHPQRRLALVAHWSAQGELVDRLERWFLEDRPQGQWARALEQALDPGEDPFWSHHWTLNGARIASTQQLLGRARLADLAVNVFLPWLWARAGEGKNAVLRDRALDRYFNWPAAQDNVVLKLARRRLFGSVKPLTPGRAAWQQGLLQIVRDYCHHSNAICDECRFPGLVKTWDRS